MSDIYFNTAFVASAGFCVVVFAFYRLNVLKSMSFVVNSLFLFTFYLPVNTLEIPLSSSSSMLIVVSQVCMNLGLLGGRLFFDLVVPGYRNEALIENLRHKNLPNGYLILMFTSGVTIYSLLYLMKGVPMFATDVAIAREVFITGTGVITWPASVMINTSVWLLAMSGRYKTALLLGFVGATCLALSGWRGQVIFMVLTLLFIFSYKRQINFRMGLIGFFGLLTIAVFGIIRSNLTGHSLYGLSLTSETDSAMLTSVLTLGGLYIISRLGEHAINFNFAVNYFQANQFEGSGLLMDFLFLLPGESMTVASFMKQKFGKWEGGGGMPVTMLGGFFADFGLPGVIFLTFFTSFLHMFLVRFLHRLSRSNDIFLVPVGFMCNFWVFGFLGSYFGNYLPFTLVYGVGLFMLYYFYFIANRIRATILGRV